jgi:hypothetical protein
LQAGPTLKPKQGYGVLTIHHLGSESEGPNLISDTLPLPSQVLRTTPHGPVHLSRVPVDPDRDHRWGSRVASRLLCLHAIAITPAGPTELVRSSISIVSGHSLCNSQVGSCNYCFGDCSAFTHVMACTLTESPSDPLHRKLRQLRCLRRRFDCYRVERTSSRGGVAPAEVQRLFTAHYYVN